MFYSLKWLKQGSDFLVTSSEPIPFKYNTIFIFRALSSIRSTCPYYVWQVMDVRVLRALFLDMTLYQWIIGSRRFEATHLQGSIRLRPVDPWRWGLPTDAASHPRRTESPLHRCKIYTTMHILFLRFGSTLAACWTRGVCTWRVMAAVCFNYACGICMEFCVRANKYFKSEKVKILGRT